MHITNNLENRTVYHNSNLKISLYTCIYKKIHFMFTKVREEPISNNGRIIVNQKFASIINQVYHITL